MKVPFYTSVREYHARKAEFNTAVQNVFERGDFILGADVPAFEEEAARWLGIRYAVGVASGSDALVLGSDILGSGMGGSNYPCLYFFSSASCLARLGASLYS
jgi:dTDP-4-amino-4,6-dideoxygalactose transaminase